MCDQDEERAAVCNAELEEHQNRGLRAILNVICKVFGVTTPWNDTGKNTGTNGYFSAGDSLQPALGSVGNKPHDYPLDSSSPEQSVNGLVPSQPSLFKGISGESAFSADSYELTDCVNMEMGNPESVLETNAEQLARTTSCTLRGLTQNLMEPPEVQCISDAIKDPLAKDHSSSDICMEQKGSSSSSMCLEEQAISVLLDKAYDKLAALAMKDRPKKRSALVSFLQRAVGRDGAKAFILQPVEVAEALFEQGLLTSERSGIIDMLSGSTPAGDVFRLADCPETQARIIRQATRTKLSKMAPVEVAKWVLMQAYVHVPLSAAHLADSLIASGVACEGSDGKLTFELESLKKPPLHIKRLFKELELSDGVAKAWKEGSSVKQSAPASQSPLSILAAAFPDRCPSVLKAVLEEHSYDINSAVEALLDSLANSTSKASADSEYVDDDVMKSSKDDTASSLIAKGLDAMAGAMSDKVSASELAREAEAVAALKQQLSFLDFHISNLEPREENATPDLLHEISMLRRSRAAVDAERVAAEAALTALRLLLLCDDAEKKATSGQVTVSVNLDVTRRSQSLRGHERTVVSQIQMSLQHSGPWGHYAAYQFAAMLSREQELHKDFICFYHSYSYAALLYEVQAELARRICRLPDDFAPLPRVSMEPFNVCKSMSALRDWAQKQGGNDHESSFRGVGLSLSCSLFASGSEAPPLNCFKVGYSCTDLSFRKLLTDTLGGSKVAEQMADALVDVGRRHGLPVQGYASQNGDAFYERSELTGYMLQIFVHRSIVEEYAYPSQPFGVPLPGGIVDYVENGTVADGQARLYFHPKIMLDPRKARLFHYCARPSQSSLDPGVPSSRGSLVKELRAALAPLVGDDLAIAQTATRLGLDVVH
eukprot:gnl/MRDRNA2_/MRDRNA2_28542_c0_seq1.p1 gnl/MRDRNA2_/MRDRNA2_28542_c0~~gnl/MRDRNA2_/MRDRNA2_28542_c0_seq1.p1  ORF type:complete len:964 (+),score=188.05 gnl/MRDRNA2_/MRDRNA2_28542_c0_seq1:243-2894(+)